MLYAVCGHVSWCHSDNCMFNHKCTWPVRKQVIKEGTTSKQTHKVLGIGYAASELQNVVFVSDSSGCWCHSLYTQLPFSIYCIYSICSCIFIKFSSVSPHFWMFCPVSHDRRAQTVNRQLHNVRCNPHDADSFITILPCDVAGFRRSCKPVWCLNLIIIWEQLGIWKWQLLHWINLT